MRLRGALYLLTALSLGVAQTARADIIVGVITSLTGPSASVGRLLQKALVVVPDEVDGQKINYIVLDDATDPSLAVRDARKLITEKNADIILGPTPAPVALAVAASSMS
jgi:branched-chain amino acid transport system substrate-binding protein